MRRLVKLVGYLIVIITIGIGVTAWWASSATQQVPEFYQTAVASVPANLDEQTQQLQDQVQHLSDQVGQVGNWQATFDTDHINAWLATELENQFRYVLPRGTQDPRVMLQDGKVLVAARYKSKRFDSVISFELHARLTDSPNVVALQVQRLRAGALPIPIRHFADKISFAAAMGDIMLRWEEEDGVPIALVTVPSEHDRYVEKPVVIETLDLCDGRVCLAGRTGKQAHAVWSPGGPIYRLAKATRREIVHN